MGTHLFVTLRLPEVGTQGSNTENNSFYSRNNEEISRYRLTDKKSDFIRKFPSERVRT